MKAGGLTGAGQSLGQNANPFGIWRGEEKQIVMKVSLETVCIKTLCNHNLVMVIWF